MSKLQYRFKYDEYGNTREIVVYSSGNALTSLNFVNKGTAFNEVEREAFGLEANLPPSLRNITDQILNTRLLVESKVDDIERYIFIRSLHDRNVTLAHALIKSDLKKYMGIVYTPTISEAVRRYSSLYRQANGLHFSPGNIDRAEDILRRYVNRGIRIAVVSDSQGIPGIGDQGAGGIAVCLGKLMLYSQGAGFAPWHCLPILLDVGTNNERLLNDSQYLGWRHKRLESEEYLAFIGKFARAFRNVFPDAICQWQHFSVSNSFGIRDAFSDELISFNDNIQCTGAIAASALLSALRKKGERFGQQKFIVDGGDAAAIGICEQILTMLEEEGESCQDARDKIFLVDNYGLVTKENCSDYFVKPFAQPVENVCSENGEVYKDLAEFIKQHGVTAYISTRSGGECLDKRIIDAIMQNTSTPIILPLNQDVQHTHTCLQEMMDMTNGNILSVSTNSDNTLSYRDKKTTVSRANNIFIYPGVALGAMVSGAREITPQFFTEAAVAVSKMVTAEDLENGKLLPSIDDIEKVTDNVALAVAMAAVEQGVSRPCVYSDFQHENDESRMRQLIKRIKWEPNYLPLVAM